ncbi:hypothetical protein HRbin19_00230 [bacterium HR19]|nr:hypothetical protein HRbin19_00230 [bacterium HR19]
MKKLTIMLFSLALFTYCGQKTEKKVELNFSGGICVSLSSISISTVESEGGRKFIISCGTTAGQISQNAVIAFFSDGEISIIPIENNSLNINKKVVLISSKIFLSKEGVVLSTYSSQGNDLFIFKNQNFQKADISISTFIKNDSNIMKLFSEIFSSQIGVPESSLQSKDVVIISTYLDTNNLSYFIFPIFEETLFLFQKNFKVRDIKLVFPSGLSGDSIISVSSQPEITLFQPILFPVASEYNLSEISYLSQDRYYYEKNLTESPISIPIFLSQASEKTFLFSVSKESGYFFKGEINPSNQNTVEMVPLPPKEGDLNTTINFDLQEENTKDIFDVEIFSELSGSLFNLIQKSKVDYLNPHIKLYAPKDILYSSQYIVKIQTERKEEDDKFVKRERLIKYEVSESPFVRYSLKNFKYENFVFGIKEIGEDKISLFWRVPEKLDVAELGLSQLEVSSLSFANCITEQGNQTFIKKECFTPQIHILAEGENGTQIVWRVFNLYQRSEAQIPNLLSPQRFYEITGSAPKIKIKSIKLHFALYTGTKLFIYERSLEPK